MSGGVEIFGCKGSQEQLSAEVRLKAETLLAALKDIYVLLYQMLTVAEEHTSALKDLGRWRDIPAIIVRQELLLIELQEREKESRTWQEELSRLLDLPSDTGLVDLIKALQGAGEWERAAGGNAGAAGPGKGREGQDVAAMPALGGELDFWRQKVADVSYKLKQQMTLVSLLSQQGLYFTEQILKIMRPVTVPTYQSDGRLECKPAGGSGLLDGTV